MGLVPEHGDGRRQLQRGSSDDVQVCWTNAGAGGDEYDKFQTAVSAGSGAPDVVMVEADRIPTFQVQDALVDLSDLGYEDVKANFSDGAWKDVSVGDGVYGAPIDGGPMGMIYRTDIFDQYGITPPTTWAELRGHGAEGEGCRRPGLRELRREPARLRHGATVPERRASRSRTTPPTRARSAST